LIKRLLIYSVIWFLSGLLFISCDRVRASREEPGEYQPRPAPAENRPAAHTDVKGELIRVDLKNKAIMVRAENGMEQTFRFNDETSVRGADSQTTPTNRPKTPMAVLIGKEGSEVTIAWDEEAGAKMATSVTVDQLVSGKDSRPKH
jgi:hypothetical protein